jgi:hypothetical protein
VGFRQAERGEAFASFSLPFEYVTKSKNNREKNGIEDVLGILQLFK